MSTRRPDDRGRLRPFWIWLAGFYLTWLSIVVAGNHAATLLEHWPIAAAMAAGSYFAGSTPMGANPATAGPPASGA